MVKSILGLPVIIDRQTINQPTVEQFCDNLLLYGPLGTTDQRWVQLGHLQDDFEHVHYVAPPERSAEICERHRQYIRLIVGQYEV